MKIDKIVYYEYLKCCKITNVFYPGTLPKIPCTLCRMTDLPYNQIFILLLFDAGNHPVKNRGYYRLAKQYRVR